MVDRTSETDRQRQTDMSDVRVLDLPLVSTQIVKGDFDEGNYP